MWDQLTCTNTTYWGGEWEDGLLYCLTNLWNTFWLILQFFTCSAMSEEDKTGDGSRRGVWAIPPDSRECLESPAGRSGVRPQPFPATVGQDQTWGLTDTDNPNQHHCNRAALIQLQHLYQWLLLTQCCLCFMSLHLLVTQHVYKSFFFLSLYGKVTPKTITFIKVNKNVFCELFLVSGFIVSDWLLKSKALLLMVHSHCHFNYSIFNN